MFVTRFKAGPIVLLFSSMIASLTTLSTPPPQGTALLKDPAAATGRDDGVPGKDRLFTPDGKLIYLNVYSTDPGHNQDFLYNFVFVNTLPGIRRVRGVGAAAIFGKRGYAMRIRLNPDHMRAHNVSIDDIKGAFQGCSMIGSLEPLAVKTVQSDEYELTHIGLNDPEQYENIILKANSDGEVLRLKDVCQVELGSPFFGISSDIDGHPAATFVLTRAPGCNAADVIKAVKEELKHNKEESWPSGMEFSVIPLDRRDMVYAVIQTRPDSTLEYTSAKCHELGAIARGIDGITSVSSLVGYQIRTERRDRNVGTCLFRLKDRSDRKLTSRQMIETLEEKCRTMDVDLEFFEPPAVSVFVAAGGFSVRVLDKTNSNNDGRPGRASETFLDDLLKREKLETLFHFLASNYPQYELVINRDVATRKGVPIADAIESRFKVADGDGQAEPKVQKLVEDYFLLSFKNDRGEMVPYSSFLELRMKQGVNEFDR